MLGRVTKVRKVIDKRCESNRKAFAITMKHGNLFPGVVMLKITLEIGKASDRQRQASLNRDTVPHYSTSSSTPTSALSSLNIC